MNLDQSTQRRLSMLLIAIIAVAACVQMVRIVQVRSKDGSVPFLSANDRSRWCTIASLAIEGTYAIDKIIEVRDPETRRRTWYSIDMVRHRGADGQQHFYSSKPPLLPTIYAGIYLVIRGLTGASLMKHTFWVAQVMLTIVNLVPLIGLWWILGRWTLRELSGKRWSISIALTFLCFGTFLSTFCNTLNNHLIAAVACGFSLWSLDTILTRAQPHWGWFVLCGIATSFTAANELPALAWTAAVSGLLLMTDWRRCLSVFLPAMLPVTLAFFATNYWAHGVLRPAYAHRDLGQKLFEMPMEPGSTPVQMDIKPLLIECESRGIAMSSESVIRPGRRDGVFEVWDAANQKRLGLKRESNHNLGIYEWDDWYDYPGSYWVDDKKKGVDKGEPSYLLYAFHCLIGHHGIFSLTPFWLLSLAGFVKGFRNLASAQDSAPATIWGRASKQWLWLAMALTSAVCIAFYLTRPLEDRNYGGVTSGLRWLFWLIPFWYLFALQTLKAIDREPQRDGNPKSGATQFFLRRAVEIALAISIFSANYAWSNPWTSPWLYTGQ